MCKKTSSQVFHDKNRVVVQITEPELVRFPGRLGFKCIFRDGSALNKFLEKRLNILHQNPDDLSAQQRVAWCISMPLHMNYMRSPN